MTWKTSSKYCQVKTLRSKKAYIRWAHLKKQQQNLPIWVDLNLIWLPFPPFSNSFKEHEHGSQKNEKTEVSLKKKGVLKPELAIV